MRTFNHILVLLLLILIVVPVVFHPFVSTDFTELSVNHPSDDYLNFTPVSVQELMEFDSELSSGDLSISEKFKYISDLVADVRPFPSFPDFPFFPSPALKFLSITQVPLYIYSILVWFGSVLRWFLIDIRLTISLCAYIFVA